MGDILGTHYKGCWWHVGHHACAVAKVEELWAKLNQTRLEVNSDIGYLELANEAEAEVEQLRELFVAAQAWRFRRGVFTSMRNSIHAGLRHQALGVPAQEVKDTEAVFWSILAELELEEMKGEKWIARAGTEVERLRAELAQVSMVLTDANELHAEVRAELAQVCAELNRVRQDAQDQSDEVQAELAHTYSVNTGLCADLTLAEVRLNKARQYSEGLEHRIEILNQLLDSSAVKLAEAEALAALVTPELAALLERLAEIMPAWGDGAIHRADLDKAGELAARIREALGETGD